jgi:hypothetical protein
VDQLDQLRLSVGQTRQLQATDGDFEGADGHVQPHDLLELPVLEQFPDELALAALQVEDPPRPARPESCDDRPEPLVVQSDRLLQRFLSTLLRGCLVIPLDWFLFIVEAG